MAGDKTACACCQILLLTVAGLLCSCSDRLGAKADAMTEMKNELATLDSLLRNEGFAKDIAATLNTAYNKGIGQEAPPFLDSEEDSDIITVSKREEKIGRESSDRGEDCHLDHVDDC